MNPIPILALSLVFGAAGLAAQATPARAVQLRDDAQAAWQQKNFRAASDHLQAAYACYRESPGDHLPDIAVICRAIVWNEVDDGRLEAAERWFQTLVGHVPARATTAVLSDLRSAYSALYVGVSRTEPPTGHLQVLTNARGLLQQKGHGRLAAQCEHDRGSLLGAAGDLKGARSALAVAVAERQRLGDDEGLAWSHVNLANYELAAQNVDEAVRPLLAAAELLVAGRGLAAQAAHAVNIGLLFERAAAVTPTKAALDGMWRLAELLCASSHPFVMPPDRVLREVLAVHVRTLGPGKALAAATRAAGMVSAAWPVEVAADVRIRIAFVGLAAGAAGQAFAEKQLAAADVGSGPCARHLSARRVAALAALAAARGKVDVYEREAAAAVAGITELGDRAGLLELLRQVSTVSIAAGRSVARDRFAEQLAALLLEGGPGGDGSMASMARLGELPADASEHTRVFSIAAAADPVAFQITDHIGGRSDRFDLRWKPHNANWNGCGLGFFGGYFVVRSLQYGTNGASQGAPGQTTLDALGSYLPLPGTGRWELTVNGAVRYVRGN